MQLLLFSTIRCAITTRIATTTVTKKDVHRTVEHVHVLCSSVFEPVSVWLPCFCATITTTAAMVRMKWDVIIQPPQRNTLPHMQVAYSL